MADTKQSSTANAYAQALMELGALVCSARAPKCPDCPVRRLCLSAEHFRAPE